MKFMALGGIDHIGSSCYYLELDGRKFLLDCGKSLRCCPDLDALLRSELVSLSELDAILISHGHSDHVSALPDLRKMGCDVPAYATGMTTALMDVLMVDKLMYEKGVSAWEKARRSLHNESVNRTVRAVSYYNSIQFGTVRVTFFPAGHVPGGAMIYLESTEGNVLYTGDFRKEGRALTDGYYLPTRVCPDTVILCGTHAKHPNHYCSDPLVNCENSVRSLLNRGEVVHMKVAQLTKGLETACYYGDRMPRVRIYLDDHTWNVARRIEEAGFPIMRPNFFHETQTIPAGSITVGGRSPHADERDFVMAPSLHASFEDCTELIRTLRPATVFLVHSPANDWEESNDNALQNALPDVRVIHPKQGHLYN